MKLYFPFTQVVAQSRDKSSSASSGPETSVVQLLQDDVRKNGWISLYSGLSPELIRGGKDNIRVFMGVFCFNIVCSIQK